MTTIRTYIGEKKHEKGLRSMLQQGWVVTNTVSSVPRRGCLGLLFLGVLFRKRTRFVVTLSRPD